MADDPSHSLSIEPHDEGWAIVADGDIVAITADRAEAETIAKLAAARIAQAPGDDQLRVA